MTSGPESSPVLLDLASHREIVFLDQVSADSYACTCTLTREVKSFPTGDWELVFDDVSGQAVLVASDPVVAEAGGCHQHLGVRY